MPIDQFSHRLNLYQANHDAFHPTGECQWESFAQDIVKDIDAGVNELSRAEANSTRITPCFKERMCSRWNISAAKK